MSCKNLTDAKPLNISVELCKASTGLSYKQALYNRVAWDQRVFEGEQGLKEEMEGTGQMGCQDFQGFLAYR